MTSPVESGVAGTERLAEVLGAVCRQLRTPRRVRDIRGALADCSEPTAFERLGSAARQLGFHSSRGTADVLEVLTSRSVAVSTSGATWEVLRRRSSGRYDVTAIGDLTRCTRSASRDDLGTGQATDWLIIERDSIAFLAGKSGDGPWSRAFALLFAERGSIAVVLLYALLIGVLSLVTPIAVQGVVNTLTFGSLLQPLVVLVLALASALGISVLLRAAQVYVVEILQRRYLVRLAEEMARRFTRLDGHAPKQGELVQQSTYFLEISSLQKATALLLLDGSGVILQTLVGMLLLAFYHPLLLAFDLLLVLCLGGLLWAGRGSAKSSVAESDAKYEVAAWLSQMARTPELFASTAGATLATEEIADRCRRYLRERRRHFRLLFRQTIGGMLLQLLAVVLLLGLGGWLVLEGELTLGQLVAAELVIGAVGIGFGKLGSVFSKSYDLVAAASKIGKALHPPQRRKGGDSLRNASPMRLVVSELELAPGPARLSFEVEAGSKVLVSGSPLSGKSRLLECCAGLARPLSGTIRWDGLNSPDLAELHSDVALVQTDRVFPGSILDNLRVADPWLPAERARHFLRLVGLDRVLDDPALGLDLRLLSHGAPLTGREIRRLGLARALAARPRLLLLDGALDHLGLAPDRTERLLAFVLGDPAAPWTVLCTSRDDVVVRRFQRAIELPEVK